VLTDPKVNLKKNPDNRQLWLDELQLFYSIDLYERALRIFMVFTCVVFSYCNWYE